MSGKDKLLAPLGNVEPHAAMLRSPPSGQIIYKIMSTENFIRCITGNYLHFSRVDSYADDLYDGAQLTKDIQGNESSRFEKTLDFSASDYYNRSRQRTYACCFSTENSNYIWENYGNDGSKGKVGIALDFDKLRSTLNSNIQQAIDNNLLEINGVNSRQIFSINYGLVEYVNKNHHQTNNERLANPILYTYLKDNEFKLENELRVSLSAIGIGHMTLKDGSAVDFPNAIPLHFDFKNAIITGVISELMRSGDCDFHLVEIELAKLSIGIQIS